MVSNMKDFMFAVSLALTALIGVACSNDSVAEWLAPHVKQPFVIINKDTAEGSTIEKTYDCDSKVIVYTLNYRAVAVVPFQTQADHDVCKGSK